MLELKKSREMGDGSREIRGILTRVMDEEELTTNDAERLCHARGSDLHQLMAAADEMRRRQVGDVVTYVINRNINFTNVCIKHCTFCAFSRTHREEEGYFLPMEEIMRRVDEAVAVGATEVCMQAGLAPKMDAQFYVDLCSAIRSHHPELHIHAFSPEEVLYASVRSGHSIRDVLIELKRAGLNTLPGTSAEILDQELRDKIAPGRITCEQWLDVIRTAHDLGIRTTSSMGRKYPSSSRWSRLNAQNVQCLMHTFVKLMLRLTTYVTTSLACRCRISSATRVSACRSRPLTCVRAVPSSTDNSPPSSTPPRMRRTSRLAQSRLL